MSDESVFTEIHEMSVDLPPTADDAPDLVLKWRRRGAVLEGLVSRELNGRTVTEWLPALHLAPKGLATEDLATASD